MCVCGVEIKGGAMCSSCEERALQKEEKTMIEKVYEKEQKVKINPESHASIDIPHLPSDETFTIAETSTSRGLAHTPDCIDSGCYGDCSGGEEWKNPIVRLAEDPKSGRWYSEDYFIPA